MLRTNSFGSLRLAIAAVFVFVALAGAFTKLGILDRFIPGDQLLYLSPSGRVAALPRTGGLAVDGAIRPAPLLTESGWRPVGAMLKVGDTLVAFPARSNAGGFALILRGWKDATPTAFASMIDLGSDAHHFTWSSDTFVCITGSRRAWLVPAVGATSHQVGRSTVVGLGAWWHGGRSVVLSWGSNSIAVSSAASDDSALVQTPERIASAGLWTGAGGDRRWVYLSETGALHWQGGVVDTGWDVSVRLLPDVKSGNVLAWNATTGDLWRVRPGVRVKLASTLADVMTVPGGEKPEHVLLGGTLAASARTLGEGIRHLGSFHQKGGSGVGLLRVSPSTISPSRDELAISLGVLADGPALWKEWLTGPNRESVQIGNGSVLPVGVLSTRWNGKVAGQNARDGVWFLHASVQRDGVAEEDSVAFEVDGTAPSGAVKWDTGSVVGPARPRRVDLSSVIDNGDAKRRVRLVVLLRSGAESRRIEVLKSSLTNSVWEFDGTDGRGNLLPEGSYTVSYVVMDSVSNATDTVQIGGMSVRWGGPVVQVSVTPVLQPAGVAFNASLLIEIDGNPNADVSMSGFGPDTVALRDTLVPLAANGHGTLRYPVRSNALNEGIHAWNLRFKEAGSQTDKQAVVVVGSIRPRITNPESGQDITVGTRAILVRGIAADPRPTVTGTALYRLSLHKGRLAVPASTSWERLQQTSGFRLLPVISSKVNSDSNMAIDLRSNPGSVGEASRLGQDEPLASIDPAWLTDTVMTLVLWVGKNGDVATHSVVFHVKKSVSKDSTLSLRLVRPGSPILDRSDAVTGNDTLHWQVDGLAGEQVVISVFDANGSRVQSIANTAGAFDMTGFSAVGTSLPSGNYQLVVEASSKGRMQRLDTTVKVVAARNVARRGMIEVSPSSIDLGMVRQSGEIAATLVIDMTEPESTRVLVRHGDSLLTDLGTSTESVRSLTWSGVDASGLSWFDPDRSPARGFGFAQPLSIRFVLQRRNGASWASLDSASLAVMDLVALPGQIKDLRIQGKGPDSFRVADLISDWKMKARLEGNLAYFPKRTVRWDVLPYGSQTARRFLPVPYSMEWAKYYNSIAGYQNYWGNWEWEGYYWALTWSGFKLRHPRGSDNPVKIGSPFWMIAHPGETGIGARGGLRVVPADSFAYANDTDRVGLPPTYRRDLEKGMIEIERMGRIFRIDPRKFFGSGINGNFPSNDQFNLSNKGYSGLHNGSPVDGLFNSSYSRFRSTVDTLLNGYCIDPQPRLEMAMPNALRYFLAATDGRAKWDAFSDTFKISSNNPRGYDPTLSSRYMRLLANRDPNLMLCPEDTVYPKGVNGRHPSLPLVCIRHYAKDSLPHVFADSILLATSFEYIGDRNVWLNDSAYDRYWSLHSIRNKSRQDSISLDSLKRLISWTLGLYYARSACKDSTLETVLWNMKSRGIPVTDSIKFQDYLDSINTSGMSWAAQHNISSDIRLDRPWVGIMDDAHFDPLPRVWNQFFYIYGPGYAKVNGDSAGKALYWTKSSKEYQWVRSSNCVDCHNDLSYNERTGWDSSFGGERLVVPNPSSEVYKEKVMPGSSERWFFVYTDDLGGKNYGYEFQDIYQGGRIASNGNDRTYYSAVENLGLRNQYAYSVPPRLNWMHPWFYLHDSVVTQVHRTLYYDTVAPIINDGLRWDANSGGRTIDGLQTFGGYKAGQIGYWFRPSRVAIDSSANIGPRRWPKNSDSIFLKEPDYIEDYAHHVGPDTTNLKEYSNHDIMFRPRLKVNDTTRGVVWDTLSVPWPNPDWNFARPDHLDLQTLQDRERGGDGAQGRTWARIQETLMPDSVWIPEIGKIVGTTPLDTIQRDVWSFFPHLPDERNTAQPGLRSHRLYSFVRGGELVWTFTPTDTFGNLMTNQNKIAWSVDYAMQPVTWNDGWTGSPQSYSRKAPVLSARYMPVPDTLYNWNSSSDSSLSTSGGWFHLDGRMNVDSSQYHPRQQVSIVPQGVDTAGATPCYRPWVTSAFVRLHPKNSPVCTDSISVNPNLLLQQDGAKWELELYYPDGQTPNLDIRKGGASLRDAVLQLSSDRSSQRWVKLHGSIPGSWTNSGSTLPLLSWSAWGIQGRKWSSLDLPVGYTDSVDLTKGIRGGRVVTAWDGDTTNSAVVWWNVTGQWGDAFIRIRALYGDSLNPKAVWTTIPFVIGTPRDSAEQIVTDAYNRAQLRIPGTNDPTAKPIVLHTLAGDDLGRIPLRNAVPVGPVIQLSPSGTIFPDSAPAVLTYRLTLREILREKGVLVADSVLTVQKSVATAALNWAAQELSVWLLTDAGTMSKVPTMIFGEGDSVTLEGTFAVLQGIVQHFSYAGVFHNNPTGSLAPKWRMAVWKNALTVGFDHTPLKRLGGALEPVVVKMSWTSEGEVLADSLTLPQSSMSSDSTITILPASWTNLLASGSGVLRARYSSAKAWSLRAIDFQNGAASFGSVEVTPSRISEGCSNSVQLQFTSDVAGVADVRVRGLGKTMNTLYAVQAGSNALTFAACQDGNPLPKGIYSALVQSVGSDGVRTSDSTKHLVWFGIDTTVPNLGKLMVPGVVAIPTDTTILTIRAGSSDWPDGALFSAAWRQVRDRNGLSVSNPWQQLGVTRRGDSLVIDPVPSVLKEGEWNVGLEGRLGAFRQLRTAQFRVIADSAQVSIGVSTDQPVVGTPVVLELNGQHLASWRLVHSRLGGSSDTLLSDLRGSTEMRRSFGWASDSSRLGSHQFCLTGNGRAGGIVRVCDTVVVRPPVAKLSYGAINPGDTLWLGWSKLALERKAGRRDSIVFTGILDKPATLVRTVRDALGREAIDSVAFAAGTVRWPWGGDVDGQPAARGRLHYSVRVKGDSASYTWMPFVSKPPRAFIWAGRTNTSIAEGVGAELGRRGVAVQTGDAAAARDFLSSAKQGGLILLDSILDPSLWQGGFSGPLFDWASQGGDLVMVGSQVLRGWNDGSGIRDGRGALEARLSLYGVENPTVSMMSSLVGGLNRSCSIDSVDGYVADLWPAAAKTPLRDGARLRWFDSAGIVVEAGWIGRIVDSLRYKNRRGADTSVLDTALYGSVRYFPPKDSGPRKGALLEVPAPTAGDASALASYVWAQLFVPDLGVSSSDIVFVPRPRGKRGDKWSPIRGDTIEVRLTLRVRDGGMEVPLDTAVVRLSDQTGLFDTTLVVRKLTVGKMRLPVFRRVLPDTFPHGDYLVRYEADTLRWLNEADLRESEPYLRNNSTTGSFLVGDTARPRLWWVDSIRNGARVRPVPAAREFVIEAKGTTIHHRPNWKWWWKAFIGNVRVKSDSGKTDEAGDTALFTWSQKLPEDVVDGDVRLLRLTARDKFGNVDSIKMTVVVDDKPPVFTSITADGIAAREDSTLDGIYVARIDTGHADSARVVIGMKDNRMLGRLRMLAPGGTDTIQLFDTLQVTSRTVTMRLPIQSDAVLASDGDIRDSVYTFFLEDAARIDTTLRFVVVRDVTPPIPWVSRVRVKSSNDSISRKTILDRYSSDKWSGIASTLVSTRRGFVDTSLDVRNETYTWAPKQKGVPVVVQVVQGEPIDLLCVASDNSSIDSIWANLDGIRIDTSFFRSVDGIIQWHPSNKLIRVTPNRSEHVLIVGARDAAGNIDSTTIVLQDSLADLQVIDSANDHGTGADWGEVYMRRDDVRFEGKSEAETWDYWLIHRRNPLDVGETDPGVYRLIIDVDTNSATGDQGLPAGFKGADIAIEWGPQTRADDGTAVEFRKLVWNPSATRWDTVVTKGMEGIHIFDGFALDISQADDPSTDSVGEGDQRLPTGTIAKATGGVTEIGLRNSNRGSLVPIRWAIIPVSDPANDTVRDSTGGMLTFRPKGFKQVKVDAVASDWWPDRTRPRVESFSQQDPTDARRMRLWVRNPGTVTVDVDKAAYWVHSLNAPVVQLDSTPAGRHLEMIAPVLDSTKGLDIWRVEIKCGKCLLVGGSELTPLGQLAFTVSDDDTITDDWSYLADTSHANGHLPLYAEDGHILWGSEPAAHTVLPIVAKISPSQSIMVPVGTKLYFSADSSYDPEGQPLMYVWNPQGFGNGRHAAKSYETTMDQAGHFNLDLHIWDLVHTNRRGWTTVSIDVYKDDGSFGDAPVKESTLVVFDDRWNPAWSQGWESATPVRSEDSVWSKSGIRERRLPVRGDSLLSFPFDSAGAMSMRVMCDSTYWKAQGYGWCHDGLDLSKFTNLEFHVASDDGLRRPIRIWVTHSTPNGQGNSGAGEEDFGYITTYLPDATRPSDWQYVSIPLSEIVTEAERNDGWLKIKVMIDDRYQGTGACPRVLMDQIELVRYATSPGEVVTTRRSGIQVLANTKDPSYPNQLGMAVRVLNSGSIPVSFDSLRLRMYYRSKSGERNGDTAFGIETPVYALNTYLPVDSTINRSVFAQGHPTVLADDAARATSSHFINLEWATPGTSGLRLRQTASASFWTHAGRYSDTLFGNPFNGAKWNRYAGVKSLNWSWPDSSDIWQFAPHIVVDGLKSDGSWGRMWGVAPGEDPASVSIWNRERLRDPSEAVLAKDRIVAKIRIAEGSPAPNALIKLSADSSLDPLGRTLTFNWIDTAGTLVHQGVDWTTALPMGGRFKIRLIAIDGSDYSRSGKDSLVLDVTLPGVAMDSTAILRGPTGAWSFAEAWGSNHTGQTVLWSDSTDLVARDSGCPVRLRPVGAGGIMRIPFGYPGFTGVRFEVPKDSIDLTRWSHLEMWVASEREFAMDSDRERPIRIWMTHQVAPGTGADNHVGEEDFSLLHSYLPEFRLKRVWQKVSIPLSELIQVSPTNNDTTKWFLKVMKHWAYRESDTARDADLLVTGMRFVRHASNDRLVTTRRTSALAVGSIYPNSTYGGWHGTLRVMNSVASPLYSDSLRIRILGDNSAMGGAYLYNNTGDMGSDESVSSDWFNEAWFDSIWTTPRAQLGRTISGERQAVWSSRTPLIGTRGWQGLMDLAWHGGADSAYAPWFLSRNSSADDIVLTRLILEHRTGAGWSRLWGVEPGETWRSTLFDGRAALLVPADTVVPPSSWSLLQCTEPPNDTVTDTTTVPPDTSSTDSNHTTRPGVVSDLGTLGQQVQGATSVVVGGNAGVQVTQLQPDFSIHKKFIFDSIWAKKHEVLVDLYIPSSQIVQNSWLGTLSVVMNKSGQGWPPALTPVAGGDSLSAALGQWHTFRFTYSPLSFTIGGEIEVHLEVNANNGGSPFVFVVGSIRVGGPSDTTVPVSPTPPSDTANRGATTFMDDSTGWTTCNQCQMSTMPGGSAAIGVVPNGGNVVMSRQIVVDSSFHAATAFEVDAFSEFALSGNGWETWSVALDLGGNWRWYSMIMPGNISQSKVRLRIPFAGSDYPIGSTVTLNFAVNTDATTSRIRFDNFAWVK